MWKLFEIAEDGDTIHVFKLEPNFGDVREFIKQEMKKIPDSKKFYRAIGEEETLVLDGYWQFKTTKNILNLYDFLLDEKGNPSFKTITWGELEFCHWGGMNWHYLEPYEDTKEDRKKGRKLLNDYYKSWYSDENYLKVIIDSESKEKYSIEEDERYFILTSAMYLPTLYKKDDVSVMEGIVSITKPLFLFHYLERGYYSHVLLGTKQTKKGRTIYKDKNDFKDIKELLTLFTLSECDYSLSLSGINNSIDSGLVRAEEKEMMEQIESSQQILKLKKEVDSKKGIII